MLLTLQPSEDLEWSPSPESRPLVLANRFGPKYSNTGPNAYKEMMVGGRGTQRLRLGDGSALILVILSRSHRPQNFTWELTGDCRSNFSLHFPSITFHFTTTIVGPLRSSTLSFAAFTRLSKAQISLLAFLQPCANNSVIPATDVSDNARTAR